MVSIITPVYNHDAFLDECINSVLNQTYFNWELIIVDDGSTDKSRSIVQKYIHDERIHYINTGHLGPEKLDEIYNIGLEISNGDYIAILEGDDKWPKYKLELQIGKMKSEPSAGLSYGKVECFTGKKKYIPNVYIQDEINYNSPKGSALNTFAKNLNFIPAVTAVIRKEVLNEIGGFTKGEDMNQVDYSTWLNLSLVTEFNYIDKVLGEWRRHENSITSKKNKKLHLTKSKYFQVFVESNKDKICNFEELIEINNSLDFNKKSIIAEGKNEMLFNNFKKARKLWIKAIRQYKCINVRTLLGLIFSFLRVDIFYIYYNIKTYIK